MSVDHLFSLDAPWPHQLQGVGDTIHALENGTDTLCLTSPTGSGKTDCMLALTRWAVEKDWKVLLFTNRILLTQQTRQVFHRSGVLPGVISSSMPQFECKEAQVQIATMQTVLSRQRADESYWVDADLVLVDEVHQQATGESADLVNQYKDRGAKVVGVTATPLGVSNVCGKLIVAAGTRDLQDAGILCYASWFAPSELDTRKLVKSKVNLSLTENDARRTWGPLRGGDEIRTRIVGNILEHYERLHPSRAHTLAFAPGVKESLWAAQFCQSRGIPALHVDGTDFWVDGKLYDRKADERRFQGAMTAWRDGEIQILWNRFVLREGIDEPQIRCLMLATPVGSFRGAVQMVGRALRDPAAKDGRCLVIDFGGNWWRHFSPEGFNVNIDWESVFECDDPDVLGKNRIAKLRETGEPMGRVCPKCGMVHKALARFTYCQYCGHELKLGKPSRPILQADGTLTEVHGEPIKQWKIKVHPNNEKTWAGLYWNAMRNKGGEVSFNQLYQQFGYKTAVEQGSRDRPAWWKAYYPPRDMPLMPVEPNDWHDLIRNVSQADLH